MKPKTSLKIVLIIAIAGLIFSGYLSFTELFAGFCGASQLGLGSCTKVQGIPACVFGFVMYLIILIITILGLIQREVEFYN